MKRFLIVLFNLLLVSTLVAQIGHGGQPVITSAAKLEDVIKNVKEMANLPLGVQRLTEQPVKAKGDALRFAHPFFVEITPENSGEWAIQKDGTRIWRLGIRSNGAFSINLIFDRFNLAPGVSVYIFDPKQSMVLGAFTHLNNQPSGILATAPIAGDEIIVEMHVPGGIGKKSELMIGAINHDYLNLFPHLKSGGFGDSGSCNVDFTCVENGIWNLVGRSVCKIIVDGTELCSGTLLNNTRNDGTPYFLTAAHCLKQSNSASTVVFYFNYQVPKCETTIHGVTNQTLSGSSLKAYAETLDFALLEMSSVPPILYRPVWAGWNRSTTPTAPVRAIHHPEGDVKKVAQSNSAPTMATFSATSPQGNTFLTNSHWRVASWQSGTTEPGSSGCALFDNNGLLLGSLSGGAATCANPVNDYFVRFNKAWNHFPESDKQLAFWLDPDGTSPIVVAGYDYFEGAGERLSNFVINDIAALKYLNPGKGVWSGHNSLNVKSIAEKYAWISSATIHGIYLVTAKSVAFSSKTVNLKLWKGQTEPETLLTTKNGIRLSQLTANRDNLVMLDAPVWAEGPIWIEVELDYSAPVDSFALYQSAPLQARIRNTAWLKNDQYHWIGYDEWLESHTPASFWMDILATDVLRVDTSVSTPKENFMLLFPNPACNQLNVMLDKSGIALIEVFNMIGQHVKKASIIVSQGEGNLNLSDLNQGLYLFKLTIDGQVFIQKLMVGNCVN